MEQGEFLYAIGHELESTIRNDQLLRALRGAGEDVASKLQDSKPFKEAGENP